MILPAFSFKEETMTRKKTAQAAPSGDPPAPSALSGQVDAMSPAAAPGAGEAGGTEPAATLPGPPDAPALAPERDTRERVKALVLHDSIYGQCGEVREFDADHVSALKGAGYIDLHPKAVESAGG